MNSVYIGIFLAFTFLISYFYIKRTGASGCLTKGYVGLVVLCINVVGLISLMFLFSSIKDVFDVVTSGQNYTASVISFTEKDHYDSETKTSSTMYTPTVRFTTNDEVVVERELSFSTSNLQIEDTYRINYDEKEDRVITLGFVLVIQFVGSFIFSFVLIFVFSGLVLYAFGGKMKGYYSLLQKVGFYFFFPLILIGFNALLIYGFFYSNDVPVFVSGILIFFIIVMTLATIGYLKMLISEGAPKMK